MVSTDYEDRIVRVLVTVLNVHEIVTVEENERFLDYNMVMEGDGKRYTFRILEHVEKEIYNDSVIIEMVRIT